MKNVDNDLVKTEERIRLENESSNKIISPARLSESHQFLISAEVQQLLRISKRTLQNYRDKGLIAFYKIDGIILYNRCDIEAFLIAHYQSPVKRINVTFPFFKKTEELNLMKSQVNDLIMEVK